jgi:hypothetical protein
VEVMHQEDNKMIKKSISTIIFVSLATLSFANDGLVKDIKYISNDGIKTINKIICKNTKEALVYTDNKTRETIVNTDNATYTVSKDTTLDNIIEDICQ